jgi:hypothetical protein
MSTRSRRRKARATTGTARPAVNRTDIGPMTLWSAPGTGVAVLMDAPDPAWPAELRAAYRLRRDASLFGRCACGAVSDGYAAAPGLAHLGFVHEDGCPASDDAFKALLRGRVRSRVVS